MQKLFMLPKRVYKISGISFLLIGIVLFLNTIISITGFAIIEDIEKEIGSFWTLWFIAVGIALLIGSHETKFPERSNGGINIVVTRPFERAIRNHDLDRINEAIRKIGTGLGNEHYLRGKLNGYKSISAGHDERIIFSEDKQRKTAYMVNYLSDHDYRKFAR